NCLYKQGENNFFSVKMQQNPSKLLQNPKNYPIGGRTDCDRRHSFPASPRLPTLLVCETQQLNIIGHITV
ncbi:hypothetical protein, partial [Thiolapillus sp.]|uniref:hypothetical protein n=1 Tax=Thiolapillus sp. TaxID=2017437 RepID=UPI003AF91FFE